MSLIHVSNLSFSYENSYDEIFSNTNLQINTDWKLGLIGRNGRGKTTFLQLLLGNYEYSGQIHADVEFEYFPYPIKDQNRMTLDIVQEICPNAMDWEIFCELNLLDADAQILYQPFNTLSNGEQTKVLLASLFLVSNAFLLIDEPTNHLDVTGRDSIKNYLKQKKGFILISHDRVLLDECVDHILSINRNNIDVQKGNFSSWQENKERQDHFEIAQNEKLKKEISQLSQAAKRNKNWSDQIEKTKKGSTNSGSKVDRGFIGHRSAKMMKRSKSIESRQHAAITEKSKLLKNIENTESLALHPLAYHSTKMLSLRDVSILYDDRPVCHDITLSVSRGDRIALQGKNGCGKSSILKLICGENISFQGTFQKGGGLKISYVPQDTSFLRGNLSDYALENGIEESLFKAILRKLGFSRLQFEKDISSFSSGQKKEVLIAKSLCEQAHLYIWDEPLNYIDVFARIQIEQLLLDYKPTMIFVEHDTTFVEKIATEIISVK